jgi:hypothetical protein
MIFLLALLLAQDNDVYAEKATGLQFAKEIGGLTRGNVTDYAEKKRPDLGVGINYQLVSEGKQLMSIDIYIYDLGQKEIPEGVDGDLLKKMFEQSKQDIIGKQGPGGYFAVKHIADGRAGLGAAKGAPPALKSEFELTLKEGSPLRSSFVYLLGHKKNFIKIRVSYLAESKKACEPELQKALAEIGRQIKPGGK